ncbi:MAG: M23 family metallopeptidase [Candidatus Woesearchaeota archaeon]
MEYHRKAQFWNLWMLIAFIIILILFAWYVLSSSSERSLTQAGEQSAQIYTVYQEKERILLFLDQAVDHAAREALIEVAGQIPSNCMQSATGRPIIRESEECLMEGSTNILYMSIVQDNLNNIISSYPYTRLPNFTVTYDPSLVGMELLAYSNNDTLIQPPPQVLQGETKEGFPTIITGLSTIRPIPQGYNDLLFMIRAINNPEEIAEEHPDLKNAIEDAIRNPSPYCESDNYAIPKFFDDAQKILQSCVESQSPCLCSSIIAPRILDGDYIVLDNDNDIVYLRETATAPNYYNKRMKLTNTQFLIEIGVDNTYIEDMMRIDENPLYIYHFPKDKEHIIGGDEGVEHTLTASEENRILISRQQIIHEGNRIPYCSNLPEVGNYKVNIFGWDLDIGTRDRIIEELGSLEGYYDIYHSGIRTEETVNLNLVDPTKMDSKWNGKAINVILLPDEDIHDNNIKMGVSSHEQFIGLQRYIHGFIRMRDELYYIEDTINDDCLVDCISVGGTVSECRDICTECHDIEGTISILSSRDSYSYTAPNPGLRTEKYGNAFRRLVSSSTEPQYPYLVIYYPTKIIKGCGQEPLDNIPENNDIDTQGVLEEMIGAIIMGMNAYFASSPISIDTCIDYPIQELLYNPISNTYTMEDIFIHASIPRESENIWPIELGRITQCYGPAPEELGYRNNWHIGFDMQPPPPRIGYKKGLEDHFPKGVVNASFTGNIYEYGRCLPNEDNFCYKIEYVFFQRAESRISTRYYDDPNPINNYGEYIIIKHPEHNLYAVYAHLKPGSIEDFFDLEALGDAARYRYDYTISQGTAIGIVGNTGRSTGAHLHYEVYSINNGIMERHNPLCFLPRTVEIGGHDKSIIDFFPERGEATDIEGGIIGDDDDSSITFPDSGFARNCFVNYYDAYYNAGIQDVCPIIT